MMLGRFRPIQLVAAAAHLRDCPHLRSDRLDITRICLGELAAFRSKSTGLRLEIRPFLPDRAFRLGRMLVAPRGEHGSNLSRKLLDRAGVGFDRTEIAISLHPL